MKNLIMFFVLVMVMIFSNYEVSYSQEVKTGNFYFLVGTEGNERAIMYLHIVGTNAYGSYYTESQSIDNKYFDVSDGFSGSFDGENLKLEYGREWDSDKGEYVNQKYITGTLSGDIVFSGKHNSKNVNLSLANAPINTMKIFDYNNGEYGYSEIIHPKDYDERKLINNYNSIVKEHKKSELEFGYVGNGFESSSESISYIDDRIIIFYGRSYGYYGGAHEIGGESFYAYTLNSKEYSNAIKLSDFIANIKDRRLLSLIRDKFYQSYNWDEEYDYLTRWSHRYDDFDSLLAEDGGIENYDFLISPQGAIKILFAPYDSHFIAYEFEATFTFEELKPYINRGSPLDYLFN